MSKNDSDLLFQMEGVPPLGTSISLALQHLVAMIVGCVTPAIIIANAAGLPQDMRVLLIQSSLVVSAISTLIQVYPIGGKKWPIRLGAGLPVILGISFAYLPSMQAIVESLPSTLFVFSIIIFNFIFSPIYTNNGLSATPLLNLSSLSYQQSVAYHHTFQTLHRSGFL